jgi:uncharacterized protein
MDWVQTLVVAMGYFIAGLVKGATGLGYSTTALPILTLAIGLRAAMPLVLLPSMASNFVVMASAGHFGETLRRFLPLYFSLLPGLMLGLTLLLWVDQNLAAGVLGLVIITYSIFALRQPAIGLPVWVHNRMQIPIGFINGFINGLTGSQIMPLVPFMLSLKLDPDRFVQAVNISFTLSSLVMMLGLFHGGLMTWNAFLLSVAGIFPAMLGGWFGGLLRRRLPETGFRRLVLAVLLVLGCLLATRFAKH